MPADKDALSVDLGSLEEHGIHYTDKSGDNSFFTFCGDEGYGRLRVRYVSLGVALMYNEYRLPHCKSAFNSDQNLLVFEFCSEGRMDFMGEDGQTSHFEAGDLCITNRSGHAGEYRFPLNHYIGVTIGFDMDYFSSHPEAQRTYPADLKVLQAKFLLPGKRRIIRSDSFVARICSGFYGIPAGMKEEYYKLLIGELLLYLDAIEPLKTSYIPPYLDRGNLDKIRAMRDLMTGNLLRHYTIKELSELFDISPSTLKVCFKKVYGEPVFSYMRSYRINKAAVMLVEHGHVSIADAAACVGYANPSKFSDAFREVMGSLPREYRKRYADERAIMAMKDSAPI